MMSGLKKQAAAKQLYESSAAQQFD
jgi:hypothetical protein